MVQQPAATGGTYTPWHPRHHIHRPAPRGQHITLYHMDRRRLLQVAGAIGIGCNRRSCACGGIRRHRPPGVPGRGHPHRPAPHGRPCHGTAVGAHPRDLRRGRRIVVADGGRLHPRLPGREPWAAQRGLHDQALSRRRAPDGRRRRALLLWPGAGLSRRQFRVSPDSRSRLRSKRARRRSCPTTVCRSA